VKQYRWNDIGNDARRQYMDARSAFTAWEEARKARMEVRGSMKWREIKGAEYLLRVSTSGAQKSIGPRSPATEEIYQKFIKKREELDARLSDLHKTLERHERMNRALFVGRAPKLLVSILNRLEKEGLAEYFTVVGAHALYAYEAASGVTFSEAAVMETKDIDLLFDVRKRLSFVTHMDRMDTSILKVLKKEDPTFRIRTDQIYTAVNSQGFEVDIIRREQEGDDPHPLRLSDDEDELYAVPAKNTGLLLNGPRFSAMIVSINGAMARMNTISPVAFASFKKWLAGQPEREALKRQRDQLQAEVVEELINTYLPQLAEKKHDCKQLHTSDSDF